MTSYKPYGEIHRTDSSGPDITRFKYTGQEEDKESGLMYYKARYYDPMIGRFLQADSVVMPESTFGMNRYMYTEGNPVRFGDASGHKKSLSQAYAVAAYLLAPSYGIDRNQAAFWGYKYGRGLDKKNNRNDSFGHRAFKSPNPESKLHDKYIYAAIASYIAPGDSDIINAAYNYGDGRDTRKKYNRIRAQLYLEGFIQIVAGGLLIFFGWESGWAVGAGVSLILSGIGSISSAYSQDYKDANQKQRTANCIIGLELIDRQNKRGDTTSYSIGGLDSTSKCVVSRYGEGNKGGGQNADPY